ncbi:MAG: hypothetical protein Q8O03_02070 [Nanoarchaeota archaeon]|nr:hypothetical protein [Nanoarchaeota archaeon]
MKKMDKFFDKLAEMVLPILNKIIKTEDIIIKPIMKMINRKIEKNKNVFVPPFTEEELGVTAFDRMGCGSRGRIVAKIGGGHK